MSDKKIVQFDTRAGNEVVQEYDHHLAAVNTITFVDEGRRFMTTSDDKSLRAWDYNIPVPIKYIAESDMFPMTRAAAHAGGKYVAYQSSDNQILVYGANDQFRQEPQRSSRATTTRASPSTSPAAPTASSSPAATPTTSSSSGTGRPARCSPRSPQASRPSPACSGTRRRRARLSPPARTGTYQVLGLTGNDV